MHGEGQSGGVWELGHFGIPGGCTTTYILTGMRFFFIDMVSAVVWFHVELNGFVS